MGNKKRKTDRGKVPAVAYEEAEKKVQQGMSQRKAAKEFGINRESLRRYLKNFRQMQGKPSVGYSRHKMVFSDEMEKELAEHCIRLCNVFHGLTLDKMKSLAFEFADGNGIQVPINWTKNRRAGKDWAQAFLRRHDLSLRKPEATSLGRATSFNRVTVNKYFDNLYSVFSTYNFSAETIYNMDETGCCTSQIPAKVICLKGSKQVGSITSYDRGKLVTMIGTINAIGNSIPPVFIFPRVHFKSHMLAGAPAGSLGVASQSGWVNEDIFVAYLDHFIKHAKCSRDNPVLLVLDNHSSHITLRASIKGRENGIIIVTIHPHTSHKLQPLDRTVYGPFKTFYNRALDTWMRSNPGKVCSIYHVAAIANQAYALAFTHQNIVSGFRSTGIFPLNRDVFGDVDYAPSELTNRPNPEETLTPSEEQGFTAEDANGHTSKAPSTTIGVEFDCSNKLCFSSSAETASGSPVIIADVDRPTPISSSTTLLPSRARTSQSSYISPRDVIPEPKASLRKGTYKKRKKGRSLILTSTPEKVKLNQDLSQKRKMQRKNKETILRKKSKPKKKVVRTPKLTSSESEDEQMLLNDETDEEESELWFCEICGEPWENSRPGEIWCQCSCSGCHFCNPSKCRPKTEHPCISWAHSDCTDTSKTCFVCHFCE